MSTENSKIALQAKALEKENITEKVLAELETRYAGLTIKGPDDKAGFQLVHDARMQCRSLRVLATKICKAGREEAVAEQRRWLAAQNMVTSRIEAIEKPLRLEEDRIIDEVARIKKEKAEAESRRIADRINRMAAVGGALSFEDAKSMSEEVFNSALETRTADQLSEQEAARVEAERVSAEQAERDRIAAEEKERMDAQQAELRRKAEELSERERAIMAAEGEVRREAQRIEQEKRHAAMLEEAKKLAAEEAVVEERMKRKLRNARRLKQKPQTNVGERKSGLLLS